VDVGVLLLLLLLLLLFGLARFALFLFAIFFAGLGEEGLRGGLRVKSLAVNVP
jgi:hypothetical protein